MTDDYSDLYEASIKSLGTGGYCDLAAEVLREFHPDAETYRITDSSGDRFAHVFLMVGDTVLDINGSSTLDKMLECYMDVGGTIAGRTTPADVAAFFLGHGREPIEYQIVTTRFRDHIRANPKLFLLDAEE